MITNQLHHLCAMSANMPCFISSMKIDLKKSTSVAGLQTGDSRNCSTTEGKIGSKVEK